MVLVPLRIGHTTLQVALASSVISHPKKFLPYFEMQLDMYCMGSAQGQLQAWILCDVSKGTHWVSQGKEGAPAQVSTRSKRAQHRQATKTLSNAIKQFALESG